MSSPNRASHVLNDQDTAAGSPLSDDTAVSLTADASCSGHEGIPLRCAASGSRSGDVIDNGSIGSSTADMPACVSETAADVPPAKRERHLQRELEELAATEAKWGADHACVAECLRRLAQQLESAGRTMQAVPLWLRVLEIEVRELGVGHSDVQTLRMHISDMLATDCFDEDIANAFAERLSSVPSRVQDSETCSEEERQTLGVRARSASVDLAVAAASLGGAAAISVGSALASGAVHFGVSTVSKTCSIAADTATQAATLAVRGAVSVATSSSGNSAAAVGALASPEAHGATAGGVAMEAVGLASKVAFGATRSAAGSAASAASHVGAALASDAAGAALRWSGRSAVRASTFAAQGTWDVVRRASGAAVSAWSTEPGAEGVSEAVGDGLDDGVEEREPVPRRASI
eukprot:TRINITY_DN65084_c0_g1_i1.p1 TRINITY_DN65084_c0_g1~~TRINITY_DN65084_c0_g1_i1.p1  ORF type:complete len:406 (+),score=65.02 TRINITY_DN65084_c0_g1_i1:9-1226(+)